MAERQLYLLSPYRLPTHHQVYLNEDEMHAWMNGFLSLWHPALLLGSQQPPKIDSPYDHDFPQPNQVFVIAQSPALFQSDDWPFKVREANAIRFQSVSDREQTFANLRAVIEEETGADSTPEMKEFFRNESIEKLWALPMEQVQPFLSIGFGYLMVESLFDAMDHEHLLDVAGFMNDLQSAIDRLLHPEHGDTTESLQDAAKKLQSAREVLYSTQIHLLDLALIEKDKLPESFPDSFAIGFPLNLMASGQTLERLAIERPELTRQLRDRISANEHPPTLEICGGTVCEREDALLPVESQLWNFRKGRQLSREATGAEIEVHARKRMAFSPQTPLWLYHTGYRNALLFTFDNSVIPNYRATLVNWPSPDGKAIDAFTRLPANADQAQTFFNLVYSLNQSIGQDTAPTFALLHRGEKACPYYRDWLELSKLAPVLGEWTTFSRFFSDAMAGEYTGPAGADEFFPDYLEERINAHRSDPVSAFARQARFRRRIDSVYTLAGMWRVLNTQPPNDEDRDRLRQLRSLEDEVESIGLDSIPDADGKVTLESETHRIENLESYWMQRLAERLQIRAAENQPGYLLINPCSFPRRVVVEIDDFGGPIPIEGPVKAGQFSGNRAQLVVEVAALGFTWIPRGKANTPLPKQRIRMAEGNLIRNEFLEAEIDPQTGGLKSIRDTKTYTNRLGQQLIYNPGSRMEARSIQITSNGTALGEIVSEGVILNEQNEELATFRQRFRLWLSRPVLDLRIEIQPSHLPSGYPWHSYFGSRFAWRDERTAVLRGQNGSTVQTTHTRPQTPDFLELRLGRSNAVLFTEGLPFLQKQGARMVDLVLIPEGEQQRTFDLAFALDRDNLQSIAMGLISPLPMIQTSKGPPHIGPTGWLFHVDAPNLLMSSLKPYEQAGGANRAIVAQFLETTNFAGSSRFQSVRNPVKAMLLDGNGVGMIELPVTDDAVSIDFSGGDLVRVQIDYD